MQSGSSKPYSMFMLCKFPFNYYRYIVEHVNSDISNIVRYKQAKLLFIIHNLSTNIFSLFGVEYQLVSILCDL